MDLNVAASWVSAVCAVLSLVGGGFAFWQANLSKKARNAAKIAERQAEEHERAARELVEAARAQATAAEDQATSLRGLERSFRPPLLEAEHVRGVRYRLVNRGEAAVTLTEIDSSSLLRPPLSLPCTIKAGQSTDMQIVTGGGKGSVSVLRMRLEGVDDLVEVPVPPKTR